LNARKTGSDGKNQTFAIPLPPSPPLFPEPLIPIFAKNFIHASRTQRTGINPQGIS
jgi:hypothetical protein